MKWDNTKKLSEVIHRLSVLYNHYRRWDYDGNKLVPKYNEVKKEDLDYAKELLGSIDVNIIVEEVEGYMSLDKKKNQEAFNIWKAKMAKGLCLLVVFDETPEQAFDSLYFLGKIYYRETWTPDEFCRYIATTIKKKIVALQDGVKELIEDYGIEDIIKEKKTSSGDNGKRCACSFSDIIQYPDKKKLLQRLHELIDNVSGAAIGSVIYRACHIDHYLTREPKYGEYIQEFGEITKGKWQAIYNYFHFDDDNNKMAKASNIVIFYD